MRLCFFVRSVRKSRKNLTRAAEKGRMDVAIVIEVDVVMEKRCVSRPF